MVLWVLGSVAVVVSLGARRSPFFLLTDLFRIAFSNSFAVLFVVGWPLLRGGGGGGFGGIFS